MQTYSRGRWKPPRADNGAEKLLRYVAVSSMATIQAGM